MRHCWRLHIIFIGLLTGLSGYLSAATLEHRPYLQNATPTSMVVRWRTDTETNTRLAYGSSASSLTQIIDQPANNLTHEVKITNLTPGTKYYYAVGSSTEILAGADSDHFFETPPNPGTVQPVRIWVVGDSGTANAKAAAVRDAYLADSGSEATDLFIMLGDNAYNDGTDSEYTRAVFDMYPMVMRQTPTWPTLGNHDGHSASSSSQSGPYFNLFTLPANGEAGGLASGTEAYYSFDYANIHFVCLNSHDVSRETSGPMLTWLQSDLNNTAQPWIIAYWHHPPYSKGSHDSDTEDKLIDMRENALPILESHGVDLVLSGHSHSYERSYLLNGHYGNSSTLTNSMKMDVGDGRITGDRAYSKSDTKGAVYAVAGSSGKTSGGSLDHPAMFISLDRLGSMAIDINGNRMDAKFIDNTGVIEDNFTIIKGAPNQPPQFSNNPITKPAANQDQAYNESLAGEATDPDGDNISFSKLAGPDWLTVSSSGVLSGTPGANDVGSNSFTIRVSDAIANADVTLNITVNAAPTANQAPIFSNNNLSKPAAIVDQAYTGASLGADANDPDGDMLSFSKISGPAWLTIAGDGSLGGIPGNSDTGVNNFIVQVTDGEASAETNLTISVNPAAPDNSAPAFSSNPINKADASSGEIYNETIAINASDTDGDLLTFSKVSGPSWLTVADDGALTGTPAGNDEGPNSFIVSVSDAQASATATLNINVLAPLPVNQPPVFRNNPINAANAIENQTYSGSIAGYATDPDGDTLSYSKIDGPAWLSLANSGQFSGIPTANNVGSNSFTVRAFDGEASTDAILNISVTTTSTGTSTSKSGSGAINYWLLLILALTGLALRRGVGR